MLGRVAQVAERARFDGHQTAFSELWDSRKPPWGRVDLFSVAVVTDLAA